MPRKYLTIWGRGSRGVFSEVPLFANLFFMFGFVALEVGAAGGVPQPGCHLGFQLRRGATGDPSREATRRGICRVKL